MSDSLPAVERRWRRYVALGLGIAAIAAGLFLAGGQTPPEEPATSEQASADAQRQRECEDQLDGILAAVDPKQLGLSSRQSDRAYDLNLWREDCGSLYAAEQIAQDELLVRQLLAEDVAELTLQDKYTSRDVAHLRTTLLIRQAAEHVTAGVPGGLEQAVRLFDFVQRNVLDAGPESPTMTPYEIVLIGRGSGAQRAWLFAELLRQVELDAVILKPAAASEMETDLWLVGVPIQHEGQTDVYLFDAIAGLPIPAASEQDSKNPLVRQPATLADVVKNDGLLRALDSEGSPYRLTAEQLQSADVGLIGHSSLWSNRLATIDYIIDLRGAIFYDGLGENRLKPTSLQQRILTAGQDQGWTADKLFVWSFPEQELATFGTRNARGAELVSNYLTMLAGPRIQDIPDSQTGLNIEWDHPLIEARHLHITGAYTPAIQEYNQIRRGVNIYTVDPINDLCRESAVYWTAGCQYELGVFDSVMNTGTGGHYPPPFMTSARPIWPDGMAQLIALSLVRLGHYAEAAELVSQFQATNPHGLQYLARRWLRLARPQDNSANAKSAPDDSPVKPEVAPEKPAADESLTESKLDTKPDSSSAEAASPAADTLPDATADSPDTPQPQSN
ncbi:MAG: hypothetical protein ACK5Q5_17385 [Planctomycetaceae bacterium]